jgi:ribonuclease R
MLLMERHLGETFDAVVIAVSKEGFTVELIDHFVEGFVHIADLPDGQYRFDPAERVLASRNGKRRFRLGNRLKVQVARVDKLMRRAHFLPVLQRREPKQ